MISLNSSSSTPKPWSLMRIGWPLHEMALFAALVNVSACSFEAEIQVPVKVWFELVASPPINSSSS